MCERWSAIYGAATPHTPYTHGMGLGSSLCVGSSVPLSTPQLEPLRRSTPLSRSVMNRLYVFLNSVWDARVRVCVYRLYRSIWGRGTPNAATKEQYDDAKTLWARYQHTRQTHTEQSTHGRIHKAKQVNTDTISHNHTPPPPQPHSNNTTPHDTTPTRARSPSAVLGVPCCVLCCCFVFVSCVFFVALCVVFVLCVVCVVLCALLCFVCRMCLVFAASVAVQAGTTRAPSSSKRKEQHTKRRSHTAKQSNNKKRSSTAQHSTAQHKATTTQQHNSARKHTTAQSTNEETQQHMTMQHLHQTPRNATPRDAAHAAQVQESKPARAHDTGGAPASTCSSSSRPAPVVAHVVPSVCLCLCVCVCVCVCVCLLGIDRVP